jgi:streptogramin lyase
VRLSLVPATLFCSLALCGCSAVSSINSAANPPASGSAVSVRGVVRGGQNPISGAHVYLYAVGNSGYNTASLSILNSSTGNPADGSGNYYVVTGSDGSFSMTGDVTCPTTAAYPYTYALSVGGNSGSGSNSAATLMAPVGGCSQSGFSSTYVVVNEVSTIALANAAAGFATNPTSVSASNTSLASTALGNVDMYNLYTESTGVALATTPAGNGTVPQAEIDTLANILAACVNSNGAVTGPTSPTPCYTLFNNAPSTGVNASIPTDTATAAINIAHNPGANVANLYSLQVAGAPFQPSLTAAPNDFTIAVTYTATPALNSPGGLAIDGSGDVWVANNAGNSLTEFKADGTYVTTVTTGGLTGPWDIAIDGAGNLWVSNNGADTISEYSSSGTAYSNSPFSGGGLTGPQGLAVDDQSHLWVANPSTSVLSEFSVTNGSAVSSTGITTGTNSPRAVAIDDNGLVWIANSGGSSSVSLYDPGFSMFYTGSPFSGGGLDNPRGLAIDSNNNAWLPNRDANVLSSFSNAGANSTTGYSGGGLDGANSVTVDASDIKWVANRTGNTISEFAANGSALSPTTGFYGGSTTPILSTPVTIAIDLTGNVWVTNSGNNTVTEFVGVGTPTVTPIAANVITGNGYGDSAVNRP